MNVHSTSAGDQLARDRAEIARIRTELDAAMLRYNRAAEVSLALAERTREDFKACLAEGRTADLKLQLRLSLFEIELAELTDHFANAQAFIVQSLEVQREFRVTPANNVRPLNAGEQRIERAVQRLAERAAEEQRP